MLEWSALQGYSGTSEGFFRIDVRKSRKRKLERVGGHKWQFHLKGHSQDGADRPTGSDTIGTLRETIAPRHTRSSENRCSVFGQPVQNANVVGVRMPACCPRLTGQEDAGALATQGKVGQCGESISSNTDPTSEPDGWSIIA